MITIPGNYCPLCGAELDRVEVEGRDRRYCPDCDRVVWRNSRPVAGVAVVDAGRVLLVERATEPDFGTWGIPGGNIEYDEPPDVGAARELEEETGVGVDPDDFQLLRVDPGARGGRRLVAVRYVVARADTTGEPVARQEVSGARFAAPGWFAGTEAGIAPIDRNAVRDASDRFD